MNSLLKKMCFPFVIVFFHLPFLSAIGQDIEITSDSLQIGYSFEVPSTAILTNVTFEIKNNGTQTLPKGTLLTGEIVIDGVKYNIYPGLTQDLLADSVVDITVDCQSRPIPIDFPNSLGWFQMCLKVQLSNEQNLLDNQLCQNFKLIQQPTPNITSFYPDTAQYGEIVRIFGTDLGTIQNTQVQFPNGVQAQITQHNGRIIAMRVPQNVSSGKVYAVIHGRSYYVGNFVVDPSPSWHKVRHVDPYWGIEGSEVAILGELFSTNPNDITVTFVGGKVAPVKTATREELKVNVPVGAKWGRVAVTIHGVTDSTYHQFNPYPAVIKSFSPTTAKVGQKVKVIGNFFKPTLAQNKVIFPGGVNANITSVSMQDSSLEFIVPMAHATSVFTVQSGNVSKAINSALTIPDGTTAIGDFNQGKNVSISLDNSDYRPAISIINSAYISNAHIRLFSISGALTYKSELVNISPGERKIPLPEDIPIGIYFVELNDNTGRLHSKRFFLQSR